MSPRINASMKDVSTDFNPIEPGIQRCEIVEVKEVTNDGPPLRTEYHVKCKVLEIIENGKEEDVGRTFTDRIYIHKKDGELNELGIAQLKRYFEVTVGDERANAEDADTDELIGGQFRVQTKFESYEVKDNLTGQTEKRKKTAIGRLAPL